jgi:hypothetical protein
MLSPNYVSGSQADSYEKGGGRYLFESKILVKSPKPRDKAQRKVDYENYDAISIRINNDTKL